MAEDKEYSAKAALGGVLGGTALQTAAVAPVMIPSMLKRKEYYKHHTLPGKKRVFGEEVHFNHPAVKRFGGAAYFFGGDLHSFSANPDKMTKLEEGILAHEIGHKKNWMAMGKGLRTANIAARSTGRLGSVIAPLAVAGANTKEEARNRAIALNLPSAAVLAEEATASAHGIKHLSKYMGTKEALKLAPHSAAGLASYAAMGLPAFLAYKMRTNELSKKSEAVFEDAFRNEMEKIAADDDGKGYSIGAAAGGFVGGTVGQTAAAVPLLLTANKKYSQFHSKHGLNPGHKKVFGEDVTFNDIMLHGKGGAGYDPINNKLHAFATDPEHMTKLEEGVLAHEIGHKKNFAHLSKNVAKGYGVLRNVAVGSSLMSPFAIAAAKNKDEARNRALAMNAPAAITLAEEGTASARGIKHIAGHIGWKEALKRAPHSASGLASYAALGLPAYLAYKIKANQLEKKAADETKPGLTGNEVLALGLVPNIYPFIAASKAEPGTRLQSLAVNTGSMMSGFGLGYAADRAINHYLGKKFPAEAMVAGMLARIGGTVAGGAVGRRLTAHNITPGQRQYIFKHPATKF